jgi:ribonucleoside-diphosphate reductase alpha chain
MSTPEPTLADMVREVSEEHFNHDVSDAAENRTYDVLQRAAMELERAGKAKKPKRERLPDVRQSITHKFNVGGHKGYLTVGMFEDGRPGELFIEIAKEGSTVGGLCDSIGILTSIALQTGVKLEDLVRKFRGSNFEPSGGTTNPEQPEATSVVDYIFTWMGRRFCPTFAAEYDRLREAKSADC